MGKIRIVIVILVAFAPYRALGQETAQSVVHTKKSPHPSRLVQHDDGVTITATALSLRSQLDSYDCSHLVHLVYKQAGFPYRYATAAQLYTGIGEFRRVTFPQPGDVVAFPEKGKNGHVGIMLSPARHLFFSALRHNGPSVSSYASSYWKARGSPHFFRYIRHPAWKSHPAGTAARIEGAHP